MSLPIIEIENLSKRYRLGSIGSTSIRDEFVRRWEGFRSAVRPGRGQDGSSANSREFWALKDVSFDVQPGEVLGIVGRNGAGKSTLLKILSRITEPTSGRARLRGRVASLLEVGTGFHPELTGRENAFLNGAILGMTRAEIRAKFDEIVAFAGVEKFIDTPVKRYSSGMQVRLAFAVAAQLEPEILIVDEVLAVGDAEFQKKCLGRMREVTSNDGRTVLFVSHNLYAMESLCSSMIHLDHGRLVGSGPSADVIANYVRQTMEPSAAQVDSKLLGGLRLSTLCFSPEPAIAGKPLQFKVGLVATERTVLADLHLLFFNTLGMRIATMDLREPGGPYVVAADGRLDFNGTIASLPLVSGSYRVGLYLQSETDHAACYDLLQIEVGAAPARPGLVPHAVQFQGTTVFDYQFERSGGQSN
jgi:ABC-type polysaccharide/polyol phosphate transport system ATPase subunit